MFESVFQHLRAIFGRDAKDAPQVFIMLSAQILLVAWVISWADGMSDNDLNRTLLGDAFIVLAHLEAFVMASMGFPVIVYALSDPLNTRFSTWALTAGVCSILPKVVYLLETLWTSPVAQPALATPGGVRLAIRPQPTIPRLGFSPGASPQIE